MATEFLFASRLIFWRCCRRRRRLLAATQFCCHLLMVVVGGGGGQFSTLVIHSWYHRHRQSVYGCGCIRLLKIRISISLYLRVFNVCGGR